MTVQEFFYCPACGRFVQTCLKCGRELEKHDVIVHLDDGGHGHYACPPKGKKFQSGEYTAVKNHRDHYMLPFTEADGKLRCSKCDAWTCGEQSMGMDQTCPWNNGQPKDILQELRDNAEVQP